eukprot:12492798-Alexandrium_andersonii.AAC.1
MVRHAGNLISRFKRNGNGGTAYRMIQRHGCRREHAEFGECAWYLRPESVGHDKADSRWDTGIWLGMRDRTGEHLIGTGIGVIKVRSTRRKGINEEQWDAD